MTWLFLFITVTCAFCVGYASRRGSVCAVLAARMMVIDGKSSRFRAMTVAAAGSGAVIVPLHWLLPDLATLSAGYPVTAAVVMAGAAFGLGAWLNGACALGTLAHLTGGKLQYATTVVGMVSGALLMASLEFPDRQIIEPIPSPLEHPDMLSCTFVAALGLSLSFALYRRVPRWWRALRDPASMRLGPYRSMMVVGILGGVLYAFAGYWTYMAVLSQRAARLVDPTLLPNGWPALLCAVAVMAGGIMAALVDGSFRIQLPRMKDGLRSLAGGAIMGASAAIIPGGNGTLLIHGLPSLAPHAIAAILAMTGTLCLCFMGMRALSAHA